MAVWPTPFRVDSLRTRVNLRERGTSHLCLVQEGRRGYSGSGFHVRFGRASTLRYEQAPLVRHALELLSPSILEGEAAPRDEILHCLRNEDFTGAGLITARSHSAASMTDRMSSMPFSSDIDSSDSGGRRYRIPDDRT
jgi:hypothetical protein